MHTHDRWRRLASVLALALGGLFVCPALVGCGGGTAPLAPPKEGADPREAAARGGPQDLFKNVQARGDDGRGPTAPPPAPRAPEPAGDATGGRLPPIESPARAAEGKPDPTKKPEPGKPD